MLTPEQIEARAAKYRIRRVHPLFTPMRYNRQWREYLHTEANWGGQWLAMPTFETCRYDWSATRSRSPMSDAWNAVPVNVELTPQEVADITGECLCSILQGMTYTDENGEYAASTKGKGLPTGFQFRYVA